MVACTATTVGFVTVKAMRVVEPTNTLVRCSSGGLRLSSGATQSALEGRGARGIHAEYTRCLTTP